MNANALKSLERRRESEAASLADARETLIRDAATHDAHTLANRLARLADHEGRLFVFTSVLTLAESGKADQIGSWLMMHATHGAEDSWSGRTNDAARSRHDGVLAAIREVAQLLNA